MSIWNGMESGNRINPKHIFTDSHSKMYSILLDFRCSKSCFDFHQWIICRVFQWFESLISCEATLWSAEGQCLQGFAGGTDQIPSVPLRFQLAGIIVFGSIGFWWNRIMVGKRFTPVQWWVKKFTPYSSGEWKVFTMFQWWVKGLHYVPVVSERFTPDSSCG